MLTAENLDSDINVLSQAESQKPPTHKINRSDKPRMGEGFWKKKETLSSRVFNESMSETEKTAYD